MDDPQTPEAQKIKDWTAGGYAVTYQPDAKEGVNYLKDIPSDCAPPFFEYAKSHREAPFMTYWKKKFKVVYNSDWTYSVEKAA